MHHMNMNMMCVCCKAEAPPPCVGQPPAPAPAPLQPIIQQRQRHTSVVAFASKSGLNSLLKSCKTCKGKGAIECPGCKGTGKNKKNGNIFERWKCFDCQGFGLKSCPSCGKGGLTPEQRGER